mgnify:CR=1 FL=1
MKIHTFPKYILKTVLFVVVVTLATILTVAGLIFVFGVVMLGVFSRNLDDQTSYKDYEKIFGNEKSKNKIVSIPISGLLLGDRYDASDPFHAFSESVTYGYDVKSELIALADDSEIS